jgi:hypothetical protein
LAINRARRSVAGGGLVTNSAALAAVLGLCHNGTSVADVASAARLAARAAGGPGRDNAVNRASSVVADHVLGLGGAESTVAGRDDFTTGAGGTAEAAGLGALGPGRPLAEDASDGLGDAYERTSVAVSPLASGAGDAGSALALVDELASGAVKALGGASRGLELTLLAGKAAGALVAVLHGAALVAGFGPAEE